jgi:PKD repeat protein
MIRFIVAATAALLLLPSTALAAPPTNDAFADAKAADPLPFTETLDLAEGTTQPGEPQYCYFQPQTVWYVLTPSQSSVVSFDLAGSGYGAVLNVYRSASPGLSGLSFMGCAGFGGSTMQVLEAGSTYYVQAGSIFSSLTTLRLSVREVPPPANDSFGAATAVASLPFGELVETGGATNETNEPVPACGFGLPTGSAWYSFTPSETVSVSAAASAGFSTMVAAYTGPSIGSLTSLGCRAFSGPLTIRAVAGTTYYFQVGGIFGGRGSLRFTLELAAAPRPAFFVAPSDPSMFDVIRFFDSSFDPAQAGIASYAWEFGDGGTSTEQSPAHGYAADGDYTVKLTVTTRDERTASTTQVVHVQTHDVAITKLDVPWRGTVGRTGRISVGVANQRYPETVEVQLFRSIPGPAEYELVGTLRQFVPVRAGRRATTPFDFSYTFMADDAARGKVTFKAVATITNARDALPADNTALAATLKVNG